MNCDQVRKELSLFLYGELSFEEEENLHQHLEACEGCRQALDRERALHAAVDEAEVAPPPELLAQCRRELRLKVQAAGRPGSVHGSWDRIRAIFAAGYLRPVPVLALVAAGFFAAQFVPTFSSGSRFGEMETMGPVATQIRYVLPEPSGGVRLVLDETRQRVLRGTVADERIKGLLLAAARDSADPGLRVESMDLLSSRTESAEVRSALLNALQHDPNPGVRLRALEALKSFSADPEMRSALAEVLLNDENPGVRTQAIDLLVQHKEASLAGLFQELLYREDNDYVRLRCQRALIDMNASVETF